MSFVKVSNGGALIAPPNAAPHLPPPGTQVERKTDTQIRTGCRAESVGGEVQAHCFATINSPLAGPNAE
jgi:hypothetical protein